MGKLTALKVKSLKEPGRYGDGDGLYLVIGTDGRRAWVLRVQHDGKRRDIGLGPADDVPLAVAREKAGALRAVARDGKDPVAHHRANKSPTAAPTIPTFEEAARSVHTEHRPSWKNAKHAAQWLMSLEQYAFPKFGALSISDVTAPMVRDALAEIWLTVPETARRVRQRIGVILDWGHAKGFREAETPTRAVSRGLPRQPKNKEHFAAMPWANVPGFLVQLKATDKAGEPVKLAMEMLVLTAVRSGELRGARWGEFDIEGKEWRIPATRMKAGKAHSVPLSPRALAILQRMRELCSDESTEGLVFEGARQGRPISDMTLTMLLRRMEANCTAHGFRSSFRDWTAEATNFPREVAEAALAHALESRVEAAYRRSDLLEKRRNLMNAWAGFCAGGTGSVVPMSRRKRAN
ncbi:transposase [Nitrospirillum viridazoti Y2]|uniref:Integrase n=1 Tax=Nitrospirillum amazonense TaxID=28077 RepID=A0A560IUJ0_9PROT|nr:integrase arm-type DNA-binding domain-containing protein [Nitrospirillum amazonense]EGY01390.1 transposase [Nitrospirillum amazonense Y2]TWB62231.1 integrase [Nitrospirillum amazonense]